jgi:uncharacterized OB-fold protein
MKIYGKNGKPVMGWDDGKAYWPKCGNCGHGLEFEMKEDDEAGGLVYIICNGCDDEHVKWTMASRDGVVMAWPTKMVGG